MTFSKEFLSESVAVIDAIDTERIEEVAHGLAALRERGGRLFILGVGGSAGHASHAVNDFRKICDIESYAPTDNVSELTARVNDEGWDTTFAEWLRGSRLSANDALLVFSVGGGDEAKGVSANIVAALRLARRSGARRSSASWAATAAPPRSSPRPPSSFRRFMPSTSPRTPRDCARWSGTCW